MDTVQQKANAYESHAIAPNDPDGKNQKLIPGGQKAAKLVRENAIHPYCMGGKRHEGKYIFCSNMKCHPCREKQPEELRIFLERMKLDTPAAQMTTFRVDQL